MKAVDELLARTPPQILYHYTSQAGLLGIITTKTLWVTNLHYMNDAMEFAYAIDLASYLFAERRKQVTAGEDIAFLDAAKTALESVRQINVHVFSLSEQGNLLSQWRAYCPRTGGYSIGFDPDRLRQLMQPQQFFLASCIYDPQEQTKILSQIINELWEAFQAEISANPAWLAALVSKYCNMFIAEFIKVGPTLKDPSFFEEQEWRMISNPIAFDDSRMGHRPGTSTLIPYFSFSLMESAVDLPITEIIVGPTRHRELALQSTRSLVQRQAVNIRTRNSRIPYREV